MVLGWSPFHPCCREKVYYFVQGPNVLARPQEFFYGGTANIDCTKLVFHSSEKLLISGTHEC
jgi:hypothetical protein